MKAYVASTTIKATPQRIWSVLIHAPNYPLWDPWVDRIEGTIAPGQRIKAFTKLSPGRAFPVTVTEFVPNERMTWRGGMPFGLLKGVRSFDLSPSGDGSVVFTVREEFTGPLLPLLARSLPDMTRPFEDFAAGLKARAESAPG